MADYPYSVKLISSLKVGFINRSPIIRLNDGRILITINLSIKIYDPSDFSLKLEYEVPEGIRCCLNFSALAQLKNNDIAYSLRDTG